MTAGGKGSRPRPFSVTNEEYTRRWDAIFGQDSEPKKDQNLDRTKSANKKITKKPNRSSDQMPL